MNNTNDHKTIAKPSSSSSSPSWLKLKNPRIVRVSRAFGGKDRHSKVCTVRGLRDRRIRLSVPTAIQLYDLQDRLGLNQPSKVVDWLLNAAKDDIDDLPPLQMPPLSFLSRSHAPPSLNHAPKGLKTGDDEPENWSTFWKGKAKEENLNISLNKINNHQMPNYMGSLWDSGFGTSSSSVGNGFDVAMPAQIVVQPYFPAEPVQHEPRSLQMSQFQMLMMNSTGGSSLNSQLYSLGQPARPFHFTHVSVPQNSQNEVEKNQEQFQER